MRPISTPHWRGSELAGRELVSRLSLPLLCLLLVFAVSAADPVVHTVRTGDGLERIADRYGVDKEALLQVNRLNRPWVLPGMELRIPGSRDLLHEVRAPKGLWWLAHQYGTTAEVVAQANELDHMRLHAGQQLIIPGVLGSASGGTPDYDALFEALIERMAAHAEVTTSLYFRDLATGQEIAIQPDESIRAASTIKIPIALYAYHQVALGDVSLDDRVQYRREDHFTGGSGVLRYIALDGQSFPLGYLLNLLISTSDNVAWYMTREYVGLADISVFMREVGGQTVFPNNQNVTTVQDLAVYLDSLLELHREHPTVFSHLVRDMRYGQLNIGIRAGVPAGDPVAHKYGSLPPAMGGDMAIVGGPRPYVLAILTDGWEQTGEPLNFVAELTGIIHGVQSEHPADERVLPPGFFD